ncbi:MAG: HEPN domain-containing protein [Dehalococcoidia bacterium]|nr:HEPN domain-containing protein [Dehalococcoidia bacterium]
MEQYRRGILSWDIDANATFKTATSPSRDTQPQWSESLTDPKGSIVLSPPDEYGALLLDSIDDPSALERAFQVRWERVINDLVVTRIWDNGLLAPPAILLAPPTVLLHVPYYGLFHRLVVAMPYLGWPEDVVFAFGNTRIRLVEGLIRGEKAAPMDQVDVTENEVSLTGQFSGSYEAEGRFIDIVASGESAEAAEFAAYSYLGLLAAIMGDQALGPIISSEPYEASSGQQRGFLPIGITASFPRQADGKELDIIEQTLPLLGGNKRMDRAVHLALRWYEKGGRSELAGDKFLAYFIGIEAILNAHLSEYGPAPDVVRRSARFDSLLKHLDKKPTKDDASMLRQKLTEATLTERAKFYIARRGWENAAASKFKRLARVRSDLVHGSRSDIGFQETYEAKALLLRLLKSELGLPPALEWEKIPQISSVKMHYEYATQHRHRRPVTDPNMLQGLQIDTNPDTNPGG